MFCPDISDLISTQFQNSQFLCAGEKMNRAERLREDGNHRIVSKRASNVLRPNRSHSPSGTKTATCKTQCGECLWIERNADRWETGKR